MFPHHSPVPAIYIYGGTILPGRYKGQDLNIVSVFEAVGEFTAGRMNETDFGEIERRAVPGTGSCGGMYTANTMSAARASRPSRTRISPSLTPRILMSPPAANVRRQPSYGGGSGSLASA